MESNRRRLIVKTVLATAAGIAVLGALAGLAVMKSGWYDVAANTPHYQPIYTALEQAMHESVRRHAAGIRAPALDDPGLVRRGAASYRNHCVACHGAPGVAMQAFGKSMQPVPGPLVDAARRWNGAEMYWIIRNGIKMSGMPAWEFHMADGDLWATVAFMAALPGMTPDDYRNMMASLPPGETGAGPLQAAGAGGGYKTATGPAAAGAANGTGALASAPVPSPGQAASGQTGAAAARLPDTERGRLALTQYGCHACHIIPGVTGSRVYVGPQLKGIGARLTIAGGLPNSAASMAHWIRHPQQVDPRTAMPDLGVSETDAQDMAAYLLTLR